MSWHDNYVHGFGIREGEHGTGGLVLDLDYILEWVCDASGTGFQFSLAPATLTFHEVSDLVMAIDYASSHAGFWPPSIYGIERKRREHPRGGQNWHWQISFAWPTGSISFQALGFNQVLRADPVLRAEQRLTAADRESMTG